MWLTVGVPHRHENDLMHGVLGKIVHLVYEDALQSSYTRDIFHYIDYPHA